MSQASTNLLAFLMMIRECEGTAADDGYQALFGYGTFPGRTFDDFSQHPNIAFPFTGTDGLTRTTTAAGAYQFLYRTWTALQSKLGLPDFSPASQDIAAMELISEQGAIPAVKGGDLQRAIDLCSPVWASLPASTYPQPKRTFAYASAAYADAGGMLA